MSYILYLFFKINAVLKENSYIYKFADDVYRFNLCSAKRIENDLNFKDISRTGLICRNALVM